MTKIVPWVLVFLLLGTSASAQVDHAAVMSALRAEGEHRRAEAYGAEQWRRDDLPDRERAELAIQLALVYTEQALAAPPEPREELWRKADEICKSLAEGWPENPRRVLVEVQRALASLARGEQARQSGDLEHAMGHLRTAARLLQEIDGDIDRELIGRRLRESARPAEGLSVAELESLADNVSFHAARAQRRLAWCYPPSSPDRDDALLQAVKQLTPLAQRTPADDLVWKARTELAACLRELGQAASAQKLVTAWQRENPPLDVEMQLVATPDNVATRPNPTGNSAPEDDEFDATMAAAAVERKAGRYAAAAERYRRLAVHNPNHGRAAEAHQLAALCTADLLRESAPADHPALAASYEGLLQEHLAHWPRHASADGVRLWLGKLLAGRRDWQQAIEVLQHVQPESPAYSDSVLLAARCYTELLQQADGLSETDAQRRAEVLADATSYLQPVITGPDNRWPDRWSDVQREAAVALARLHLRFSPQASSYAERLLTAALRAAMDAPTAAQGEAWQAAARLLLIEALAHNGKVAEAHAIVERLETAPAELLLEALASMQVPLEHGFASGAGDQELGELLIAMLRRADAQRSELDADTLTRLDVWRAAALAAAGDRAAALAQYAALAAQWPNDGEVQERYAALLAASGSPAELREALGRWQKVEARSRRGGPRWRRARQARIQLLTRLGDQTAAEKLTRLTRLLYPDWDAAAPSPP